MLLAAFCATHLLDCFFWYFFFSTRSDDDVATLFTVTVERFVGDIDSIDQIKPQEEDVNITNPSVNVLPCSDGLFHQDCEK